jgi:Transposase IS116/IS110/IS902 family
MPAWTPACAKSGQWSGKIKMSKRGSVALHTALYQAARMARLYDYTLQISITIIESK